jgi:hypothetical protein
MLQYYSRGCAKRNLYLDLSLLRWTDVFIVVETALHRPGPGPGPGVAFLHFYIQVIIVIPPCDLDHSE